MGWCLKPTSTGFEVADCFGGIEQYTCILCSLPLRIAVSLLVLYWVCRSLTHQDRMLLDRAGAELQAVAQRFTYDDLDALTDGFSRKLAPGGDSTASAMVYEGVLGDGTKVAVKQVGGSSGDGDEELEQFRARVASLCCGSGAPRHPNILRLRGFCVDGHGQELLLVLDLAPLGALDSWLFPPTTKLLPWAARVKVAVGTARGMAHLHEAGGVVHRDLRARNVLLDWDFHPKVADSAMARKASWSWSSSFSSRVGTDGDVEDYGVLLLELVSGRRGVDAPLFSSLLSFPAWQMRQDREKPGPVMELVDDRLQGQFDGAEALRMLRIAFWCTQEDPGLRPSMRGVVEILEGRAPLLPALPAHVHAALSRRLEARPGSVS